MGNGRVFLNKFTRKLKWKTVIKKIKNHVILVKAKRNPNFMKK